MVIAIIARSQIQYGAFYAGYRYECVINSKPNVFTIIIWIAGCGWYCWFHHIEMKRIFVFINFISFRFIRMELQSCHLRIVVCFFFSVAVVFFASIFVFQSLNLLATTERSRTENNAIRINCN